MQYMKYTSEYIPKLQIHQHSLLTRKVFSWHNSSHKSSSLDQIWIITRSSSKSYHHWIIIIITASAILIKWCYLLILLVIGSSTEPSLFHASCRPSLHVGIHLLQHLYLAMGGTHPRTMLERSTQHLHLTMGGTHPPPCEKGMPNTHIWPWEEHIHHHVRKA